MALKKTYPALPTIGSFESPSPSAPRSPPHAPSIIYPKPRSLKMRNPPGAHRASCITRGFIEGRGRAKCSRAPYRPIYCRAYRPRDDARHGTAILSLGPLEGIATLYYFRVRPFGLPHRCAGKLASSEMKRQRDSGCCAFVALNFGNYWGLKDIYNCSDK